jgi:hypothetical protein
MGSLLFSDVINKQIPPKKSRANFSLMLDSFENIESKASSNINVALEQLYNQKVKNHLIFILTDSLENIDEKKLRALALKNDLVWFHIFDSYENTLSLDTPVHIIDNKRHLITHTDEKKRIAYENLRKEKITTFEKMIRNV